MTIQSIVEKNRLSKYLSK